MPGSFADEFSCEDLPVPATFRTSEARSASALIDIRVNEVGKALVQRNDHPAAAALERVGQPDITVLAATGLHGFPLQIFWQTIEVSQHPDFTWIGGLPECRIGKIPMKR